MQMQIDYPDSLPDLLQTTRSQFEVAARMAMAVKSFELKRLSSGLAARLAGVPRVEFLLNLHRTASRSSRTTTRNWPPISLMPSPERLVILALGWKSAGLM